MAKLVDAPDLGSGVVIRVGSSPIRRTETKEISLSSFFYLFSFEVIYGCVVSLGFVVLFCSSADVMEKERLYGVDRCVLRFIA